MICELLYTVTSGWSKWSTIFMQNSFEDKKENGVQSHTIITRCKNNN